MKINNQDYIRILTWKTKPERTLYDVKEVPISFMKDGRLSRSTSFWIQEAHEYSNKPDFEVEILFNWKSLKSV